MTNALALQHIKIGKIHEMYMKGNKTLRYRRETALQGGLVMPDMKDWNWEIISTDIIGLSSTTMA